MNATARYSSLLLQNLCTLILAASARNVERDSEHGAPTRPGVAVRLPEGIELEVQLAPRSWDGLQRTRRRKGEERYAVDGM